MGSWSKSSRMPRPSRRPILEGAHEGLRSHRTRGPKFERIGVAEFADDGGNFRRRRLARSNVVAGHRTAAVGDEAAGEVGAFRHGSRYITSGPTQLQSRR